MKIPTTHMGSMPRPPELRQMLMDQQRGVPVEELPFEAAVQQAVFDAVRLQVEHGIDVVSDGEQGRPNFMSYLVDRLTGFAGTESPWITKDLDEQEATRQFAGMVFRTPACTGPIQYRGADALARAMATLKEAIAQAGHRRDAFMAVPAPAVIAMTYANHFYPTEEEYLYALAEAIREEVLAITQAGLLVQIDCPYIPLARLVAKPGQWSADGQPIFRTEAESQAYVQQGIEAQNAMLKGIPRAQIRVHICNGNHLSPHHLDTHLSDLLPLLPLLYGGALCLEGANPQHQSDYLALEADGVAWPEGVGLIIGVVDPKTSTVETAELVAERLVRWSTHVDPSLLGAGTDCGFGTFDGAGYIHLTRAAVPLKLQALAEGAALASRAVDHSPSRVHSHPVACREHRR